MTTASNRYAVQVTIFYTNKTTDRFSAEVLGTSPADACKRAKGMARKFSNRPHEIEDMNICSSLIESANTL
jgi:hypothetical protein